MKRRRVAGLIVAVLWLVATVGETCTSILVTRGASSDGSVIITYSCDGEFHPLLKRTPAADHKPGEVIEIKDWHGKVRGTIPQVAHTYAVVGLMNEHQLVIGETTFDGREELVNRDGLLQYWTLMHLALERARTAREAIAVMTDLVDRYGYASTGETFSIGDKNEAWILEMIGPGPGGHGAIWAARRVPDGFVSCHANRSRIREVPMEDHEGCLHSDNVVSFAVEHGYYDPASGRPFRFNDAYDPPAPQHIRYSATRVWSILRRVAPSLGLTIDSSRGQPDAEPYPLWVKPDHKLSVADVMALMRDHYEGTEIDMTKGVDAGPFADPNRWRPISWKVDGVQYGWERPISTQQTGFSFVSQSRAGLPDPIGGVLWYGVDDTFTTCYTPLYCGITEVPAAYSVGSLQHFSWDSAWWVFNFVANIANLKYSYMIKDIQAVQRELEGTVLALQPAVERTALELSRSDPGLMVRYLTDYSVSHGEQVVRRWRELGEDLLTKYNDGYVKDEEGRPREVGYPEEWLKRVVRDKGEEYRLPKGPVRQP
ncbi:MAG: C69 family dipeptidase [Acidobacteria bacterium]|nr:C69 family dipeptidase [Acidobacteriota bacterium]